MARDLLSQRSWRIARDVPTHVVGRDAELEQIERWLDQPSTPILLLEGESLRRVASASTWQLRHGLGGGRRRLRDPANSRDFQVSAQPQPCQAGDVPSYLVESYLADSPRAVEDTRERARRVAELGVGIRYVRTTFLPGDETVLHLFEAPSAAALDEAGRRAALPFERIVEAVERSAGPA